jgi:1-deoxy-D-xylulose-5-phosphate reductoisomerase
MILGSTGSIGTQALDVIRRNPDRFAVAGLAASGARLDVLVEQVHEFEPNTVAVTNATSAQDLQLALYARAKERGYAQGEARVPRIIAGPDALELIAGTECDVVLNGLAGAAGLTPTLAALSAGSVVALANKESLIIGGDLVRALAQPGQIVPVDSEHSAIAQALRAGSMHEVRRLVLTASGGPFRGWTQAQLESATPQQALAHPTWSMGPLVTINSATMMNKGLEVIEAHLLFDIPFSSIDVVVHPQSVVHSMVEFVDGSTMCQASPPDMRLPIALGLDWPHRVPDAAPGCTWTDGATWEFLAVDETVFPAIRVSCIAGEAGGTAPAVLNAANEVCVAEFLAGRIPFPAIVSTVNRVLDEHVQSGWVPPGDVSLASVAEADAWGRDRAVALVNV